MRASVGYSDNPDTMTAGRQAARDALARAGREDPCDLVLLFATARHDGDLLRRAVASVLGASVRIVGGGAIGGIVNDAFGYAGDQSILAALWLDGARCDLFVEEGLEAGEEEAGKRLGRQFAASGVTRESSVMLFYDAVNQSRGEARLSMATPLLHGIEHSLGFLPDLIGAGMQGDYLMTPVRQWAGDRMMEHGVLALRFSDEVRVDSIIMHGCRPATGYHTVTKADGQTIFEIDGKPALRFMENLLGPAIPVERYPFFLIFGVNRGDKWGVFDEDRYASRLCLALDRERDGIVMFEPDMTPGTEFQIMYRSLDLTYMVPRMEKLFAELGGRTPVLALYIDCAGRAAGYGGMDLEDAVVVQNTVAGRAPLLGLYTGVEIASINGSPRALDWTGVFCLLSVQQ